MRISRVRIENFRRLDHVEIHFTDVATLTGAEGVGTAAVLRVLDWFFNDAKASDLAEDDLPRGAEFSVEVEFDRLTEQDRVELGGHVTVESDRCVVRKVRHADGSETMSGDLPDFAPIRHITGAEEE
ncbi:AAA family ATPase [Umezawaea sp. Da 62-37]|uniref:AAA family ATPase n=1 Tax=Umezawaea sp. Da 62-37 TaxID=3075927 RepID=UPI0028F6F312|nr:AAA family ATPase [Umezawaea sp. Da 62-37]WNV88714.1 AAA family ATPase [Umezawaea sp. Da 62-37]